ncbi:hypothetical protein [Leptospira idonii]|uniref:TerB family tellurite resistance protein n=1 Tax=Leptospira idonii TaxID=1193500 RepID=A0A4R9M764_9LEPT|nr:hypothetical protein [Leptospira idonii]TGN20959.1 hypothetical protein EHS15_00095 [Leptospira idonii]
MDNELLMNFSIAAMGVDGDITEDEINKLVSVLAKFDISEDEISDAIDNIDDFDVDEGLNDFAELDEDDQDQIISTLKKILSADGLSQKEAKLLSDLQKIADDSNS